MLPLLIFTGLLNIRGISSSECCSNFDNLPSLSTGADFTYRGFQALYTSLNFTCDAHISRFIFNGDINNNINDGTSVKIQLWRKTSSSQYSIEDSWDMLSKDVVERDDGLLQFELQTARRVRPEDAIGIFLPFQSPEVNMHYLSSTPTSTFYFTRVGSPFTTVSINLMTAGDRTYPKLTAELDITSGECAMLTTTSNLIEATSTISHTTIGLLAMTSSTVIAFPGPTTTTVSSDSTTSTTTDIQTTSTTSTSTTTTLSNIGSQTPTTNIGSQTPATNIGGQTTSITNIGNQVPTIIATTTISNIGNQARTSISTILSTSISTTYNMSSPSSTPLLTDDVDSYIKYVIQYLVPTMVIGLGIILTTLILIVLISCLLCRHTTRSRISNPNEATEPSFAQQRPQSTESSLNENYAYVMNRMNASDCHFYDQPSFFVKPNQEIQVVDIDNRYSALNRLSKFNRNPAYNIGGSRIEQDELQSSVPV